MSVPILRCYLTGKPLIRLQHRSPGRLRLHGEDLGCPELQASVSAIADVQRVSFNPITSTLLILHADQEGLDSQIVGKVVEGLPTAPARPMDGPPLALGYLKRGMGRLDKAVYRGTNGWMDARTLIPTALGVYGLKRVLVDRRFRLPAGLTMLWWSYATLWNLSRGEQRVVD